MRLDERVMRDYPERSRQFIQSIIMQGKVLVDGTVQTKAGTRVADDAVIIVDFQEPKYVGRAGNKLERALEHFELDVTDYVVLDAGISTGGFTDCLLQRGARCVYGIDVGRGQVHEKIARDPRVILYEKTNLRTLESVGQLVDLVTLDLSFISVLKVMDAVKRLLKDTGKLIVLIKPQFEAERHEIGKGGVIKDPAIHTAVVERVVNALKTEGFACHGVVESPLLGGSGNKEFLAYFTRS